MDATMMKFKLEAAKRKAKDFGQECVNKAKAGVEWVQENKEVAIPLIVAGFGAVKTVAKAHAEHKEEYDRETRFYNPRNGSYAYAKRRPTKKESLEIERRYEEGESYRAILDDMRLLK